MQHQLKRVVLAVAGALLLAACGGDSTGPAGPPAVRSTVPESGATAAGVGTTIEVHYSHAVVLPVADATGAIQVTQDGIPVRGSLIVRDGRVLEFTPADVLELGASYVVRVTALRDRSGNTAPPVEWTFTTAGRPLGAMNGGRMFADVERLAHDTMRGRRGGTPDELKAAQYVRAELQQAGLTALTGDLWFQSFTYASQLSSKNVYGVLRGTGSLADEWVGIGAHYDHVGQSAAGIMNGADDNASGTAGMVELARALAQHARTGGFGTQPRRSVLFMAFGAEEAGLIGSGIFCATPLVPLARIAGMLNLDMIGRLRGDSVEAYGASSAAEWVLLLERYRGALAVATPPGLVGTDYRCFLQRGRPALALFTGMHEDYHKTTDDADRINVDGMVKVTDLAQRLAANLMLRPRMPGPAGN